MFKWHIAHSWLILHARTCFKCVAYISQSQKTSKLETRKQFPSYGIRVQRLSINNYHEVWGYQRG